MNGKECPWPQLIVALSVRDSFLLSSQVTVISSPFLPPWNLNCRYGFFETAGPHSALRTVLPAWATVTLEM